MPLENKQKYFQKGKQVPRVLDLIHFTKEDFSEDNLITTHSDL